MILFNTKHFELYNYIIHDFLEIEIFGIEDEEVISDMAECIYPKYLYMLYRDPPITVQRKCPICNCFAILGAE